LSWKISPPISEETTYLIGNKQKIIKTNAVILFLNKKK